MGKQSAFAAKIDISVNKESASDFTSEIQEIAGKIKAKIGKIDFSASMQSVDAFADKISAAISQKVKKSLEDALNGIKINGADLIDTNGVAEKMKNGATTKTAATPSVTPTPASPNGATSQAQKSHINNVGSVQKNTNNNPSTKTNGGRK